MKLRLRPWCFIYPVIYFPSSTQTTMDRKAPPRAAPLSENTSLEEGALLRQWLSGEKKIPDIFNRGNIGGLFSLAVVNLDIFTDAIALHCFEPWPLRVSYQF